MKRVRKKRGKKERGRKRYTSKLELDFAREIGGHEQGHACLQVDGVAFFDRALSWCYLHPELVFAVRYVDLESKNRG